MLRGERALDREIEKFEHQAIGGRGERERVNSNSILPAKNADALGVCYLISDEACEWPHRARRAHHRMARLHKLAWLAYTLLVWYYFKKREGEKKVHRE